MNPKLQAFLDVWNEVSKFLAPEFRPTITIKDDYCPYGTDIPVKAAIFNDRYAAFLSFREWNQGADEVVRLEQIEPDEHIKKRYEDKGMNPAIISEAFGGHYYTTAFFLADSILMDWQWKLKAEGKL